MKKFIVTCDRCKKELTDAFFSSDSNDSRDSRMTAGYYDVSAGYWSDFALPEEKEICDECMFKHPKYIEIYGPRK